MAIPTITAPRAELSLVNDSWNGRSVACYFCFFFWHLSQICAAVKMVCARLMDWSRRSDHFTFKKEVEGSIIDTRDGKVDE